MSDELRIIRDVLEGDVDSFRLLVERYQRPVIKMIRNIIEDYHICEDIGQDVFFTAYKKLSSFDPTRSNFSTWLFTIARNKSINAIKKKKVPSVNNLPENADLSLPDDTARKEEFFNQLDKALRLLPIRQRMAFILAEFEGLPYEQIAQIEGVRIGTVKSRINRAKKKLRAVLKSFEENSV